MQDIGQALAVEVVVNFQGAGLRHNEVVETSNYRKAWGINVWRPPWSSKMKNSPLLQGMRLCIDRVLQQVQCSNVLIKNECQMDIGFPNQGPAPGNLVEYLWAGKITAAKACLLSLEHLRFMSLEMDEDLWKEPYQAFLKYFPDRYLDSKAMQQ